MPRIPRCGVPVNLLGVLWAPICPHTVCETTIEFCTVIKLVVVTGRMPRSGKVPVLNLLTGQKSGFSRRRGDSLPLHRFTSNLSGSTGRWLRLAVQNFTSIALGVGMWPQKYQKFPLFGKESWPISKVFRGSYTPNTLVFQISLDSLHTLLSYCWATARR